MFKRRFRTARRLQWFRDSASLVNILTLSTVFPNPSHANFGIFVRARVQHMASLASIRVLAPVPLADYRLRELHLRKAIPSRQDDRIVVHHPRWIYPPGGGFLNAVCLFLRAVWPALRLDRESRIDVIDAHFAHPDGVAAAMLAMVLRRPFTITLRGNETMHGGFRIRRLAMAWALKRAARVITVSEALRQYVISLGVDPAKVKTIPNGVDTALFQPRPKGVAVRERMILSAGYLIERKGYHHLIRAVAGLRSRGVDCELNIAGGPGGEAQYEADLRKLVTDLNLEPAVHFLGAVPPVRLAELMSEAGVFCLASSREGWPNVVHEALACGAPVVATDIGGVPDMIPSAEYGLVVPAGDRQRLEQALEKALASRWNRGAIAGWGQSRSWQNVSSEVIELFAEIVAEKRGAIAKPVPRLTPKVNS
jgi:glycosyltransferase involved in cell wall biosynthesis